MESEDPNEKAKISDSIFYSIAMSACAARSAEDLQQIAAECLLPEPYDSKEVIDHPQHYGGKNNPYEAIKIIEAWGLNFSLGNTIKYILRAGKKDMKSRLEDLKKAAWYLNHEINRKISCEKTEIPNNF